MIAILRPLCSTDKEVLRPNSYVYSVSNSNLRDKGQLSAVGGQHCVSSVLGAETLGVSRSEGEQKAGFNEGHGLSDGERPRYNPECR